MKDKLRDLIIGVAIGLANILPGVSGGFIAISFNVYKKIIFALTNFYKTPIKVFKEIWALAIGIGLGLLMSILGVQKLLEVFPIPTVFLFTGLILGSIPSIYDKTKSEYNKVKKFTAFILGLGSIIFLIVFLIFFSEPTVIGDANFRQLIILFIIGLVVAATMIIPGISGSLVLLAIGYYKYIFDFVVAFIKAALSFDFDGVFANLKLVAALGFGIVVGLISLAKGVERMIEKHPKTFYAGVLGLLIASPFAVIYQLYKDYYEEIQSNLVLNWVLGILFLLIGVVLSFMIVRFENKTKNKEIDEN